MLFVYMWRGDPRTASKNTVITVVAHTEEEARKYVRVAFDDNDDVEDIIRKEPYRVVEVKAGEVSIHTDSRS